MTTAIVTPALLRTWNACWTDDEIEDRFTERSSVTVVEVVGDETISLADRLWVACSVLAHADESAARLFAIESAGLVAHLAGDDEDQARYLGIMNDLTQIELELLPDDRIAAVDAVVCAVGYAAMDAALTTEKDAAGYAARDSTWDAAEAAARAAAGDAVGDATWDAVRDATWAAADAATSAAVRDAAWDTAWDAEIRKAIARALEWLSSSSGGHGC